MNQNKLKKKMIQNKIIKNNKIIVIKSINNKNLKMVNH